jgi:hypothetical protein
MTVINSTILIALPMVNLKKTLEGAPDADSRSDTARHMRSCDARTRVVTSTTRIEGGGSRSTSVMSSKTACGVASTTAKARP